MTVKGHFLLAVALAYPVVSHIGETIGLPQAMISLVLIITGSVLPDIDEPNSYIGKRFLPLSWLLKIIGLRHRGFTHYLIIPVLIAAASLLFYEYQLMVIALLSLAFGVLAHDIGDMLTKGGIYGFLFPFFPSKKIVLLPDILRFQTFSITENFVNLGLFFLNIYLYGGKFYEDFI